MEDQIKEKPEVREQAVDTEHREDDGIIAREVSQVVVDSRLDLGEVRWLGQSLEVEELGDRLEVCKSRTQGLRSHAGETIREVQTRRKDVKGDLDARHFVVGSGCVDVVGSR